MVESAEKLIDFTLIDKDEITRLRCIKPKPKSVYEYN